MGDTYVTFHGWVGGDVTHRKVNGTSVANLRVASTPRIKRKGEWMDGTTTWYSVSAWRALADNITESVRTGDAVIVHGRLRSDAWEREDGQVSNTLLVEASFVGHDLCRGTSTFTRSTRPERAETDMHDELAEMIHREADVTTQLDSWGNPLSAEVEADPDERAQPAA
ncbi:MAG TPA: single-stranded DNA-binding protein [Nocardioidaceae bacterium]|nr:single-stranded DNA-binding protein [Nocardioidaceae bacterium]